MIHELKTNNPFFTEFWDGNKKFEYRLNDREFKKGDTVILKEVNLIDKCYTGREIKGQIKYIMYLLSSDFVIFNLNARPLRYTNPKTINKPI